MGWEGRGYPKGEKNFKEIIEVEWNFQTLGERGLEKIPSVREGWYIYMKQHFLF